MGDACSSVCNSGRGDDIQQRKLKQSFLDTQLQLLRNAEEEKESESSHDTGDSIDISETKPIEDEQEGQYSIDSKTMELLSQSHIDTPIDSGQAISTYPDVDMSKLALTDLNEGDEEDEMNRLASFETEVTSTRVKHLTALSEEVDAAVFTRAFSHQYDETTVIHEHMDEDDDYDSEEEDESSSLEEDEIEEIEFRKSISAIPPAHIAKAQKHLVHNESDLDLLKLDMQQQLISLSQQASANSADYDKDYKIEIDEALTFDDIDDDDERLPSVKANLFRNASSEKWSDHSVQAKKKEIQREMLKQLLQSNNSARSRK